MHHVCKPKRMLTVLLAVVLAGFVVQSAAAFRVAQDESYAAGGGHATAPLVVPYLSHGVGVDRSQYSGQSSSSTPLVIPYLSHGVGVDKSLYGGSARAPDVFTRAVERHNVFVNAMNATAPAPARHFHRAVNRMGRPSDGRAARRPGGHPRDHRQRHRPAVAVDYSSTRRSRGIPWDRHDLRRPVHRLDLEPDWNTVFMAGGALLGVLLIVAAAVALSRRQHGRALAH